MQRPSLPMIGAMLAALAAIAVSALVVWYQLSGRTADVVAGGAGDGNGFMPAVEIGGDFTLTDHTGAPFRLEKLSGGYALIYFGYTYCPDVCPTELQDMTLALDAMPEDLAERITPVFITVDPERDGVEAMGEYVSHFHPRMIGLTGTPEAIDDVASDYRVYHAKTGDVESDTYLVDHSSYFFLVGPDGNLVRMFSPKAQPKALADGLAGIVN